MTLAEYISSRREFDQMPTNRVWAVLLQRGRVDETATFKDVSDACTEARRLFDLYLR